MTASDTEKVTWKPIPGFRWYEASDHGDIRSIGRMMGGRQLQGVTLAQRPSNRGYPQVNLTGDDRRKQTRTVHSLMMLAFVGPCPPGMETRHLDDDPTHNRWAPSCPPGNLVYGTKAEQEEDKYRNGRPRAPQPEPKPCIRCSQPVDRGGRRCHACVTEIGEAAAPLLAARVHLDDVADKLDYPSLTGLLVLAQKYGGLRLVLATPPPEPSSRSAHGPVATLRHMLRRRGGDAA